jgi:hypothetical protein
MLSRAQYKINNNLPTNSRLDCSDLPSATQQQFADECDINNILKQYERTGLVTGNQAIARYIDAAAAPDFQDMLHTRMEVTDCFDQLPLNLKQHFGNADNFVDFISNSENHDEAVRLGLIPAPLVSPQENNVSIPQQDVAE